VSDPVLSILIVSYNGAEYLNRCLLSIRAFPPPVSYEVIVIDNGSSDESPELVESFFPEVQLIQNGENLGFAAANNRGIEQCKGEIILFLNSDTELRPHSLTPLLRHLDKHPEVGIVGPTELHTTGRAYPSISLFPNLIYIFLTHTTLRHRFYKNKWFHPYRKKWEKAQRLRRPIPVDRVSGATLMIRRKVLDAIGIFDETYFFYMEETDLCKRTHNAGWEVHFVPSAEIIHHGGATTKKIGNGILSLSGTLSELIFFRKHKSFFELTCLRAFLFLEYMVKYLWVGKKDPRQWAFRETLNAALSLRPWRIQPEDRLKARIHSYRNPK